MPDHSRIVVVNTTPLIALAAIDQLQLLALLYPDGILVPDDVWREYHAGSSGHTAVALDAIPALRRTHLADPRRAQLLSDLDPGEAAVIALGQERNADLLIIDERLGRRHDMRLGFKVTGTLGILLRAKQMGLIPNLETMIRNLRRHGLYLGDAVIQAVLRAARE